MEYNSLLQIYSATLHGIIYSLVAFLLTPKYMTLNGIEWPDYVKFSLLRTAFES